MTNYICRNVISFSPISETNGIPFFPDGISTTAIGELQGPDTYSNAKAQCESQGKHLLTVKDKKEAGWNHCYEYWKVSTNEVLWKTETCATKIARIYNVVENSFS